MFHYHHHHQILSPPITPKLQSSFYSEEEGWDSSSSTSSYHSLSMPLTYSGRQKQKPLQSLPKSTKGAFYMPIQLPSCTMPTQMDAKPVVTKKRKRSVAPSVETMLPPKKSCPLSSEDESPTTIKKNETIAAQVYDTVTVDCDPHVLFADNTSWIPNLNVFEGRPAIRISWKGSPLKIKHMPYFDKLHSGEASIAATLRLTPEQYLKCKWALVLAAKEASENHQLFRKSEAQKVCCIDVNKTSVLWHAFGRLGWLGAQWPQ